VVTKMTEIWKEGLKKKMVTRFQQERLSIFLA